MDYTRLLRRGMRGADGTVFAGLMIAPHGNTDGQLSADALLQEIEDALNA